MTDKGAPIPSGTVTFVFTDIEGSTRRWEQDPAMSAVLARHDELLRAAVESGGGRVLKHTGDGAVAVFSSAVDAVGASIAAQRALDHLSPDDDPLRVRMALHTGEAEERDGDYFGPTLNVAARVMSVAHGGQILLTQATAELVRTRLPTEVDLVDLGEQRLRDLRRPERVFQVVAPGLERTFPPLRSSIETPTNLIEQRTSFIGRRRDLDQIQSFLDDRRLITLIGVGGAGKTRLAIEAGRRTRERFPDGVYFVDLSTVNGGPEIPRSVAQASGATPTGRPGVDPLGGTTAMDDMVTYLADRQILLILDNCEHLLDDCADLVDRLLPEAPRLAVLATSREALSVEGEQVMQVRSLSLPTDSTVEQSEAMELLTERIHSVRPDLRVDEADRDALEEICVRLDGIPLALELAAGRVTHLSPREIADRLGDRFRLLAGGRRRAQRQQTLQAALDWSYELLTPDEQTLLRRLAVFSGGFALDAVEGICLPDIAGLAVDLVGSLVDKSLVAAGHGPDGSRYRLLETIRLYAEQKLVEAGESESTRARHRDWYLQRLEDEPLDRCLVSEDLAVELAPDTDNLRAALEWCAAEDRPDLLRRLVLRVPRLQLPDREAASADWIDRALEYERTLPAHERHCHVRFATIWTGDVAEIDAGLERLRSITGDLPDRHPVTAYAHLVHAMALGVFPKRADEIERCSDLAIEHAGDDSPLIAVQGTWLKATAYLYQYRYEDAAELLETLRDAPEWHYISPTLGLVRHLEGRNREALDLVDDERPHSIPAWRRCERILVAAALAALGDRDAARDRMRAAVADARHAGSGSDPLATSDCLIGFAALASLEGDHERAAFVVAAVPQMVASSHELFVLLRHHRDLAREHLDPNERRRCIDEGRSIAVDDAIDTELARWDGSKVS